MSDRTTSSGRAEPSQKLGRLDHILRPALPWRPEAEVTECGRAGADVASTLTLTEALDRAKAVGKQRAAFSLCVTCMNTAERHARAMAWAASRVSPSDWFVDPWHAAPWLVLERWRDRRGEHAMDDELRAIAELIERHADEFAALLADRGETVSLAERRATRRAQR